MKPELECFDTGHTHGIWPLLDMGVLKAPLQFSFIVNVLGGIPPHVESLQLQTKIMPAGIGVGGHRHQPRAAGACSATALVLGGNIRAGLEDHLYLPNGEMAKSNGDLVEVAARMVRDVRAQGRDGRGGAARSSEPRSAVSAIDAGHLSLPRRIRVADDGPRRATITLNNPARKNAIGPAMVNELLWALADATDDAAVRVIVLTGAGDAFCAGGDFAQMTGEADAAGARRSKGDYADLCSRCRARTKPIVARVNGHAMGGGLGLVAASHFAIAARERQARDARDQRRALPDDDHGRARARRAAPRGSSR